MEQAKHFKLGPEVYADSFAPYTEPITSPYRDRLDRGLPLFEEPGGEFPWKQEWFPGK